MEENETVKTLGTEIMVGGLRFKSNVLMAPLAGYTCFPFRLMVTRLGAGSAYTEMVSADGLKYNDRATKLLLFTDEREKRIYERGGPARWLKTTLCWG